MRVTERQLMALLAVTQAVVDGTLGSIFTEEMRAKLKDIYDEVIVQQNEIVDTSNFLDPTQDEWRRLAFDMFEALEFTSHDPEDFYQSPMGRRAMTLMYPKHVKRKQRKECERCGGKGQITSTFGHLTDRCSSCKGRGFILVEKEGEACSSDS